MADLTIQTLRRALNTTLLEGQSTHYSFMDNDMAVFYNVTDIDTSGPWADCVTDMTIFVLTLKGACTLRNDLDTLHLTPNTLSVLMPQHRVGIVSATDDYTCQMICMSRELSDEALLHIKGAADVFLYVITRPCIHLTPDQTSWILDYHRLLFNELRSNGRHLYSRKIANGLSAALFYKVCDMLNYDAVQQSKYSHRQVIFQQFVSALHDSHVTKQSVADYAHAINVTPKYLSIVIKQISGKSAGEWIDENIITHAKLKLSQTNKSVQQIAFELGFANQSFFGKYFKRHTGISPLQWRKRNK